MLEINSLGGLVDTHKDTLARAKAVDLVTLPISVKGTNCYNCKFIDNKTKSKGYCIHPEVKQYVNERMCCALWDAKGTYRAWE